MYFLFLMHFFKWLYISFYKMCNAVCHSMEFNCGKLFSLESLVICQNKKVVRCSEVKFPPHHCRVLCFILSSWDSVWIVVYSRHVSVGFLQVLRFPPTVQNHVDMWTGYFNLSICVNVCGALHGAMHNIRGEF